MNESKAAQLLEDGVAQIQRNRFEPKHLNTTMRGQIEEIMLGEHLTFRYILLTALLAKVTDPSIHMRSLQAGAALTGAYDARSLCHAVIVRFDKERLQGRLGNSNEPFLNKPARFPSIEKSNAVRAGSDQRLLDTLYDLLEGLNSLSPAHHKDAMLLGLKTLLSRPPSTASPIQLPAIRLSFGASWRTLSSFLEDSHEGQSAAAVVTAVLRRSLPSHQCVKAHPANEAGSSSNQVGDIDVHQGKAIAFAVEVKDKDFLPADVWHAVDKVMSVGCAKLVFAVGRHGRLVKESAEIASESAAQKGVDLAFLDVDGLVKSYTALCCEHERGALLNEVWGVLHEIRAKDAAKAHYSRLLKS